MVLNFSPFETELWMYLIFWKLISNKIFDVELKSSENLIYLCTYIKLHTLLLDSTNDTKKKFKNYYLGYSI